MKDVLSFPFPRAAAATVPHDLECARVYGTHTQAMRSKGWVGKKATKETPIKKKSMPRVCVNVPRWVACAAFLPSIHIMVIVLSPARLACMHPTRPLLSLPSLFLFLLPLEPVVVALN